MAGRKIRRARRETGGNAASPAINSVASDPHAGQGSSPPPSGEAGAEVKPAEQPAGRAGGVWASIDPADLDAAKQRHREGIKRAAAERRERERKKQERRTERAANKTKSAATDLKPAPRPASTFNQSGVAKILFSMHFMAASFFHEPALALDDKESDGLAKAIMEASAAWGHPKLSDKALAALNLCGTAIVVYGPRAVVMARKNRQPKPIPIPAPTGNAYSDAARSTTQAAAAPSPQPDPPRTVVKPNGGFVQAPMSPFGDQDGMAT